MTDEKKKKFIEHLETASKIVATWPKWKQNILRDSQKSTRSEPRKTC